MAGIGTFVNSARFSETTNKHACNLPDVPDIDYQPVLTFCLPLGGIFVGGLVVVGVADDVDVSVADEVSTGSGSTKTSALTENVSSVALLPLTARTV